MISPIQPNCPLASKFATVAGSSSSEEAKIGGMTPEVLIFNGRWDASPPNILLPIWRFGYWTRMRRCARSMKTMNATTATDITRKMMMKTVEIAPVRPSSRVEASACGRFATIPAMMIREMPLPTPRAVICSPSHIRKTVPQTSVTTVTSRKNSPGSMTADCVPACIPSSPTAIP